MHQDKAVAGAELAVPIRRSALLWSPTLLWSPSLLWSPTLL
ncbi:hypothetical protein [Halobaculum sp. CBA1158]|nr:hypothetical protein [Halobaculum sp. CBA1158]